MIAAQRRNKIKEIILKEGSAKAETLAKMFDVSDETIRRDFAVLEKEGYLEKNYGGAVAIKELQKVIHSIPPVQQRKFTNLKEKDIIGKYAAGMIENGARIYLDAGSTTWSIIRHIADFGKLSIITNSIDIANECSEKANWDVYVMGGQLIKKSMCMVGPNAEEQLSAVNVDIAFIGTSGINSQGKCTSSYLLEANMKKKVIGIAQKVIILADSSKIGANELCTFASLDDVDMVITTRIDEEIRRQLEKYRAKIISLDLE